MYGIVPFLILTGIIGGLVVIANLIAKKKLVIQPNSSSHHLKNSNNAMTTSEDNSNEKVTGENDDDEDENDDYGFGFTNHTSKILNLHATTGEKDSMNGGHWQIQMIPGQTRRLPLITCNEEALVIYEYTPETRKHHKVYSWSPSCDLFKNPNFSIQFDSSSNTYRIVSIKKYE